MEDIKEKTADEMFEELGYEVNYQIHKDEVLLIGYTNCGEIAEESSIMFLKKAKKVTVNVWVGMKELQAINKKCKELKWI